jgi:hypothetical protein
MRAGDIFDPGATWPLALGDWIELGWSTTLYGSCLVVGGLQQVAAGA